MAASRTAWAEAARPVLLEAAGRYRGLVRWTDLSTAVQEATGITTSLPVAKWIGDVLARVAEDCESRGEPLLSALSVSMQGTVGQGYADAVERVRGVRPTDPDEHAAQERLECYRHWEATGLPRDGGTPLRTAHFTPVRTAGTTAPKPKKAPVARKAPARKTVTPRAPVVQEKPPTLCPKCYTAVPASGICDYCD